MSPSSWTAERIGVISRLVELGKIMGEAAITEPGSQMRWVGEYTSLRDRAQALGLNLPPIGSHVPEQHNWFGKPDTCWRECQCQ